MKLLGANVGDEMYFRLSRLKAFFVFLKRIIFDEEKDHSDPAVKL